MDMNYLDEAILWFRTGPALMGWKYKNQSGKIRFKLVYKLVLGTNDIKYYELARGNSLWEALLKAYARLKEGHHWSVSVPRLGELDDVVVLDPSLKKRTKPKINRKIKLK